MTKPYFNKKVLDHVLEERYSSGPNYSGLDEGHQAASEYLDEYYGGGLIPEGFLMGCAYVIQCMDLSYRNKKPRTTNPYDEELAWGDGLVTGSNSNKD